MIDCYDQRCREYCFAAGIGETGHCRFTVECCCNVQKIAQNAYSARICTGEMVNFDIK